jgi:hypothetical protein
MRKGNVREGRTDSDGGGDGTCAFERNSANQVALERAPGARNPCPQPRPTARLDFVALSARAMSISVIWSTRKLWCTNRWALADAMISTGGRVTDRSASKAK